MLAWTVHVIGAGRRAFLGTLRDVPGIDEHLEAVTRGGYPSTYVGTAGALGEWISSLADRQFHASLTAESSAEARQEARDSVAKMDPGQEVTVELWDQS